MEENISNKNNIKNIIVGIVIFVFLIVISIRLLDIESTSSEGRDKVNNTFNVNAKSAHDKMLNYMNEKYDDEFTYKSPFGGSVGIDAWQIIVSSKKYPNADVWVEYLIEDGKEEFYDNYIDYKYEEQTREYLQKLLKESFGEEIRLVYNVGSGGTRNMYDAKITFEEYIKGRDNPICFSADINTELYDLNQEKIISEITNAFIVENNMRVVGKLYFQKNETSLFFITNEDGIETYKWS